MNTSLRESAVVAQFLADAHHSSLQPPQTSPTTAAQRARIALFVDVFFNKVNAGNFKMMLEKDVGKKEEMARQLVEGVQKEIEPFLEGAGPFFGGAEELTMAEVSNVLLDCAFSCVSLEVVLGYVNMQMRVLITK